MKRLQIYFISTVIAVGMLLSACVKTTNHSEVTHVRDLVQSDVFTILPDNGSEMAVYQDTGEIEGEYFELATLMVSMEESGSGSGELHPLEKLKQEAELLGANGVLVLENRKYKDGNLNKVNMKGIAIFALDEIPHEKEQTFAGLPS